MNIEMQIAPVYEELVNLIYDEASKYSEFSLGSGRGAGKSKLADLISVHLVMTKGCVVWCRANYNTLRDSVYTDLEATIESLGLTEYFEFKYSPLLIICKTSGYAIEFKGLSDFQKIKGLVPYKKRFALCVFEETQEIPNESYTAETRATVTKGLSENCKIMYLFNPPANEKHWVNTTLRTTIPDYRYYIKTCYTDLPKKWLGEKFLQDAEMLKQTNYKLYRYRYLGDAVNPEDAIFENLKIQEISQESINRWVSNDESIYCGLDFGYKPDPNAANEMYYDHESRTLYIYKEFEQGQLNNKQISDGLENSGFSKDYLITADNCDKDIADLSSFGWYIKPAIKGPNSRDKGFKWLCGLSQIVIDPVRCPKTANEFESYVYKADKTGAITGLFPEGLEDHHIAAVRYALESVWRRKGV